MVTLQSQKHAFWQALILAILVFGTGIFLGFLLENWRTSKIEKLYIESDLELLDIRIQNELYGIENINCENAIKENIAFADKVYREAKLLDRYEKSSRISDKIKIQHKKYDLLRTLFWINSIKIKKTCNASYHNVVYLYKYNDPTLDQKAAQTVFSNILQEIKEEKGSSVMLIPIAADNDLRSVNLFVATYNITKLPTILVDEKFKITEVEQKEELKKLIE